MRILVVGASGTLGKAVKAELAERHEVIAAGRSSGEVRMDITDPASIRAGYDAAGPLDAVVSAAGQVTFAPFADMRAEEYAVGIADKLMGQVNLVLIGRDLIADGGSFTLISGVLDTDPILAGTSASMVNGALNAFVVAAAIEMPRGRRINSVSPGVFVESLPAYGPFFRGFEPVPVARAARAFAKSVEGAQTGRVYRVV